MMISPRSLLALLFALVASVLTPRAHAQALPTATGPGPYVSVGGSVSAFQAQYGQRLLGGWSAFSDVHVSARYGFEAEYRSLTHHSDEGVTQRTILAGPHVYIFKHGKLKPYAKFLVGQGHMTFPFGYASGNYLAMAPGAGLDIQLLPKVQLRLFDIEYQSWPQFTYGNLHPYGISMGLHIHLTRPNIFRKDPYIY